MQIKPSTRKSKRFVAIFDNKKTHFGLKDGNTLVDHGDTAKRDAYIARHRVNEDWSKPHKAGTLSRFILWGDSQSLTKNTQAFKKRFDL